MTTQSKAEGSAARRKEEGGRLKEDRGNAGRSGSSAFSSSDSAFSPQPSAFPQMPSSFPPDAFTAFAPRLETHWFLCERQEPVGKTVRYTVREKPEGGEVGFLFWDSHGKEYLFAVTQPRVFPPRWIAEMTEILVYLTQRQRRRTTGRAR